MNIRQKLGSVALAATLGTSIVSAGSHKLKHSTKKRTEHIVSPLSSVFDAANKLHEAFMATGNAIVLPPELVAYYEGIIHKQLQKKYKKSDTPETFVFVDRNPKNQRMLLGIFDPKNGKIHHIGATLVSTGKAEKGYYLTPTGIFQNNIVGWRAKGTENSIGVRGFGLKGQRLWDFGWQRTVNGANCHTPEKIRFAIHSTDPEKMEALIGTPLSHGCIIVKHSVNEFLDTYGILDKNLEKKDLARNWLLKKDRFHHPFEGQYLIVDDSTNHIAHLKPSESKDAKQDNNFQEFLDKKIFTIPTPKVQDPESLLKILGSNLNQK